MFSLDVDQVILAVGQELDFPFPAGESGMEINRKGLIQVRKGRKTETQVPGVFAGGDAVSGPDTVVAAIAAGHQAAMEIDELIRKRNGEPPYVPQDEEIQIPLTVEEDIREAARVCMPETDCAERIRDFGEVERGLTREDAVKESHRCLRCDVQAG
jgi:NADH-quinone oxidoreductase subunit F